MFHSQSPTSLNWEHLELGFSTVKHSVFLNHPGSAVCTCFRAASETSLSTTHHAHPQPVTSSEESVLLKGNSRDGQPGSLRTVRLDFPLASSE